MKKIITGIFLFISFIASAQNKATVDTTTGPVITKEGKPDGEKTEIKIAKDGGRIKSSDGKIELIIPEGAVSKKTLITIQPVQNLMSNGNGKAYRLEPSGIQFEKPLQLIFHYDGQKIIDSLQLLLGIAMQDETGQWFGLNEPTLDTVAKTISGNINHFSTWAAFEKLKLVTWPSVKRLKVNHTAILRISGVDVDNRTPEEKQNDESKMSPKELEAERNYEKRFKEKYGKDVFISPLRKRREPFVVYWYVNAVMGGNGVTGTLELPITDGRETQLNVYTAPAKVPHQNPVTISVGLAGTTFSVKGVKFKHALLSTSILIYDDDDYEVKMESVIRATDEGQWAGAVTITDEGSFIVSLKDGIPYLKNIINKLEVYKDDCINTILNPTTCTGFLHVTGIKSFIVTPANPPSQPYPIVEIWFTPYPMQFSSVKFDCPPPPGGTKHRSIGTHARPAYGSAIPWSIKFIAKDGEQIIIDSSKDPGADAEGYLKVWVRKMNDE